MGFLRVGRAAFRPVRPLAAVGGRGKRGRSGRRGGSRRQERGQAGLPRPLAGAQPRGGLATSSYSLDGGTSLEDPSYSEREDAEDGAASQETTPAPARRAVLVKPRALPPPTPQTMVGGGAAGRGEAAARLGIPRLCFLGSR